MKPFRSSFSAWMLSLGVAVAVSGGGLLAALGVPPHHGTPLLYLGAILCGIIGLVMGVADYPVQVLLGSLLLPMALWPFVIALSWIGESRPELGWALVAAGLVPVAMSLYATRLDARVRTAATARGAV